MKTVLQLDALRYAGGGRMPAFQRYYRKVQEGGTCSLLYKLLFHYCRERNHIDLLAQTKIGPGLYIGHPYGITINPAAVIGSNINIHKGVTIGQENRGERKGAPVIGDQVWIGVNATIVGKIKIGNDVLIAPNAYVNCDVPDHSIVVGNPCTVISRANATDGYINKIVDVEKET